MVKDIIRHGEKEYQLSTVNLDGFLETMIFPIENGVISGREVYCFRTTLPGDSMEKHGDIFDHPEKYISEEAVAKYLKEKEEDYGVCDFDRRTALRVLQDLSSCMYPSLDLYGNKTLVIDRDKFEKIRAKYLDRKE